MKQWRITRPDVPRMVSDILALFTAYCTTFWLRFYSDAGFHFFDWLNNWLEVRGTGALGMEYELHYLERAPIILGILIAVSVTLYACLDLYDGRRYIRRRHTAWRILLANTIILILLSTWFYLHRNIFHPRSFLTTVIFLNVICAVLFRMTINQSIQWLRRKHHVDIWPMLLIGRNRHAEWIDQYVQRYHPNGLAMAEQIAYHADKPFEQLLQQVRGAVQRHKATTLVLCDEKLTTGQIMALLDLADELRLETKVLSEHLTVLVTRTWFKTDLVDDLPLVHFKGTSDGSRFVAVELWFGRVAATVALAVFSPLLALITLLIRGTSHGPALFVQERVGVNRAIFRMLKFRTMRHRADEAVAQLEEFNESGKGLFKIRKDPRITPAGRMLRRWSLDELPQLVNVVRGEMALVGPRPLPRRDFENYYEEWHYGRHGGMPGLTCLWQVCGRSDLDFHNMCLLDIYYLKNRDLILDLQILLRTGWVVVFARGAY